AVLLLVRDETASPDTIPRSALRASIATRLSQRPRLVDRAFPRLVALDLELRFSGRCLRGVSCRLGRANDLAGHDPAGWALRGVPFDVGAAPYRPGFATSHRAIDDCVDCATRRRSPRGALFGCRQQASTFCGDAPRCRFGARHRLTPRMCAEREARW